MTSEPRRLRYGMVGGGLTGYIGEAHRIAAAQFGLFELVAGAFSSNPQTAHESARAYGVPAERSYESYEQMAKAEAKRDDGIEAVVIATPNDLHAGPVMAFAAQGIDVICDKPVAENLARTLAVEKAVAAAGVEFILTHNYSGYPLARQARQMVEDGAIGELLQVRVEYLQDGLFKPGAKDKRWRASAERCGGAGVIADIGSHAYHLACFVTGQQVQSLAADHSTNVDWRAVDDHMEILLRYANGARGSMTVSQTSIGRKCDLNFHVYGDKGSLRWAQEDPNVLHFYEYGKPPQTLQRGMAYLGEYATPASNIAAGHTEGYYEAFAQIYREAHALIAARRGADVDTTLARRLAPGIGEGVAVARFIAAAVASAASDAAWTSPADMAG